MKCLIVAALFLQLAACASPARQTEALLREPLPGVPPREVLVDIPHINQPAGHCGPAALATAVQSTGRMISVNEIAPMVMTSGHNGSLPNDMLGAARRLGMMAIPLTDLRQIIAEVAGGRSVIVFQNLGLNWAPRWHFANVVGYDLPRQEIVLHTGPDAFEAEPLRYFERAWALADFWAYVLVPAGELARADELAHLRAAVGLETAGQIDAATKSYRAILRRWPKSLGGLVGAANLAYSSRDYRTAVSILRKATTAHPDSVVARHNLDVAERALK